MRLLQVRRGHPAPDIAQSGRLIPWSAHLARDAKEVVIPEEGFRDRAIAEHEVIVARELREAERISARHCGPTREAWERPRPHAGRWLSEDDTRGAPPGGFARYLTMQNGQIPGMRRTIEAERGGRSAREQRTVLTACGRSRCASPDTRIGSGKGPSPAHRRLARATRSASTRPPRSDASAPTATRSGNPGSTPLRLRRPPRRPSGPPGARGCSLQAREKPPRESREGRDSAGSATAVRST